MAKKKAASKPKSTKPKRTRTVRPYPAATFKEARALGDAIIKFASGEKVRRLTLLEQMNRKPTSSATKQLITDSGKYGITKGSYAADSLQLTPTGKLACDPTTPRADRLKAHFKLAVTDVAPFKLLYETYLDKPLPVHSVLLDVLKDSNIELSDPKECVDFFIVNVKDLGLLRTIAGTETLVSLDHLLEENGGATERETPAGDESPGDQISPAVDARTDWEKTCFYITPIGAEDSEARMHADLFMKSLIEPAMQDLGLKWFGRT